MATEWFILYTSEKEQIYKHIISIGLITWNINIIHTANIKSYIKHFKKTGSKYFEQNTTYLTSLQTYAENSLYKCLFANIPISWIKLLVLVEPTILQISRALDIQATSTLVNIYPAVNKVFRILYLLKPKEVKLIVIGQDPYPQANIADGVSFSTTSENKIPASLGNIFKELKEEGFSPSENPNLDRWVTQGVLLINSAWTVEENKIGSHTTLWKSFVGELVTFVIEERASIKKEVIGCMFGTEARNKYRHLFTSEKYEIAHPSPNSCDKGFFGSNIFQNINSSLVKINECPIDWA